MRTTPNDVDLVRVRGNQYAHYAWLGSYFTLCGYATGDLITRPAGWRVCKRCVNEYANPTNTPTMKGDD